MLVLHRVPELNSDRGDTVYFWRNGDQEWHFSERGGGFATLENVVQQYEDRIVELEESLATAKDSRARFQVLDEITPMFRSVRNLADALHKAWELTEQQALTGGGVLSRTKRNETDKEIEPQPSPLENVWDHACEITRKEKQEAISFDCCSLGA